MQIEKREVSVGEIFEGYEDKEEEGVFAYGGRLTIRASYQREFIYSQKQAEAVVHSVLKGFPLNVMYWVKTGDDAYEILDGQQRTLSLMHYLSHQFAINIDGFQYYSDSLAPDKIAQILDYRLMIYVCEGEESEKLAWFNVVNIAGQKLTEQEIRNSVYTGAWLSAAKSIFSKKTCVAKKISERYITGNPNRQELLEKALKGICEYEKLGTNNITSYMSKHRNDTDADELWQYFQEVINWVQKIFSQYYPDMKGLDWCHLYNKYHQNSYNSNTMQKEVKELHSDDEVQNAKGIYEYLLCKYASPSDPFAARLLKLRTFTKRDKQKAYERQSGICPICKAHFEFNEMEGDHIKPWSKGGFTELENCQMLCKNCNARKNDKY